MIPQLLIHIHVAVSYTHLDVYKRQENTLGLSTKKESNTTGRKLMKRGAVHWHRLFVVKANGRQKIYLNEAIFSKI